MVLGNGRNKDPDLLFSSLQVTSWHCTSDGGCGEPRKGERLIPWDCCVAKEEIVESKGDLFPVFSSSGTHTVRLRTVHSCGRGLGDSSGNKLKCVLIGQITTPGSVTVFSDGFLYYQSHTSNNDVKGTAVLLLLRILGVTMDWDQNAETWQNCGCPSLILQPCSVCHMLSSPQAH